MYKTDASFFWTKYRTRQHVSQTYSVNVSNYMYIGKLITFKISRKLATIELFPTCCNC